MSYEKKWKIKEEAVEPHIRSKHTLTPLKVFKKTNLEKGAEKLNMSKQEELSQNTYLTDTIDAKTVIMQDTALFKQMQEREFHHPNLVLVLGPKALTGSFWSVKKAQTIVGRNWKNDICIKDPSISKKHLLISIQDPQKVFVKDLNSTNGVRINEKVIEPKKEVSLKDKDIIRLGNVSLKFLQKGNREIFTAIKNHEKAFFDSLTGAGNRFLMETKALEFFCISKKADTPLSLILFDIDFFKKINDTYGHQGGDFILKQVGQIISSNFRSEDLFIRCGGEEFCLVLHSSIENAEKSIEKVRKIFEQKVFNYKNHQIKITISAGISKRRNSDKNWKNMYDRADQALYQCKNTGRNKVMTGL